VFYTAPIRPCRTKKYGDLVRRYGVDRVGLLTGDNSVNGTAPIVVMTTEVLRNMIYAASPALDGLQFVVLDEVHYLQDTYRGPVWEEVILHLRRTSGSCACRDRVERRGTGRLDHNGARTDGRRDRGSPSRRLVNLYCVGDRGSARAASAADAGGRAPHPEASRLDAESLRDPADSGTTSTPVLHPPASREGRGVSSGCRTRTFFRPSSSSSVAPPAMTRSTRV